MTTLSDLLPRGRPERAASRSRPEWVAPMLATLTERRFSDPGWIFERKLDGERCIGLRSGRDVHLLSRNREPIEGSYPELAEALGAQVTERFMVDSEVVAFEGGQTSFARLQRRMHVRDPERARRTGVAVFLYAFDLLHLDGFDLRQLALRDRKRLLRQALSFRDPLRYTVHRNADGERFWRQACHKGWEGVIAKRADAPYVSTRSRDWLKFKCVNEQEFVIGGFTDPKGARKGFGALLIGFYRGRDLVYAGKVGTGFDDELLRSLGRRLAQLERSDPPFIRGDLPRKDVHWVKPEFVGQVGFTEWTRDGQLRHPRFQGLRRDKRPREVVRERAAG